MVKQMRKHWIQDSWIKRANQEQLACFRLIKIILRFKKKKKKHPWGYSENNSLNCSSTPQQQPTTSSLTTTGISYCGKIVGGFRLAAALYKKRPLAWICSGAEFWMFGWISDILDALDCSVSHRPWHTNPTASFNMLAHLERFNEAQQNLSIVLNN